jgi:hypothetical protein
MTVNQSPNDGSEIRYHAIGGIQALSILSPGPGLFFALSPPSRILSRSSFRSFSAAEVGPDNAPSDLFRPVVQPLSATNFP